jgi:hypothetical protein
MAVKVIAKPIEVISYTDNNGQLRPLRFRIKLENEALKVIKVDKVVVREREKLAGNNMISFRCQSLVDNVQIIFELKYEMNTCKWILFKI